MPSVCCPCWGGKTPAWRARRSAKGAGVGRRVRTERKRKSETLVSEHQDGPQLPLRPYTRRQSPRPPSCERAIWAALPHPAGPSCPCPFPAPRWPASPSRGPAAAVPSAAAAAAGVVAAPAAVSLAAVAAAAFGVVSAPAAAAPLAPAASPAAPGAAAAPGVVASPAAAAPLAAAASPAAAVAAAAPGVVALPAAASPAAAVAAASPVPLSAGWFVRPSRHAPAQRWPPARFGRHHRRRPSEAWCWRC